MFSLEDVRQLTQSERVYLMLLINVSMCVHNKLLKIEIIDNSKVHAIVQNVRTLRTFIFSYKFYSHSPFIMEDFICLVKAEFPDVEIEERSF